MSQQRDPSGVNFWLLGGGIGCLAAAVHLINEAEVPGPRIFVVESEGGFGHSSSAYGNSQTGYTVHAGLQPCFQEPCVEHLLSFVPLPLHPGETLFDLLKEEGGERPSRQDVWSRVIGPDKSGPKPLDIRKWGMHLKDRLDAARIIMESEDSLGEKSIRQVFDTEFFDSTFWILWSTTLVFQSTLQIIAN